MELEKIKDLGFYNDWSSDPPKEYKECIHTKNIKKIGNCLNEYYCFKCNIKFKIDSSN